MKKILHFSNHKNITKYYGKVMKTFSRMFFLKYEHFNSRIGDFEYHLNDYDSLSVNNHFFEGAFRSNIIASRFVRDPRDLLVSGYFYHKKGREKWCHYPYRGRNEWYETNGEIPDLLEEGESYFSLLNRLPLAEGMMAELQWRKHHFEALMQWKPSENIKVLKYENIIGNEYNSFLELARHYGFNKLQQRVFAEIARYYSAERQKSKNSHIRNPEPEQWRKVIPENVLKEFNSRYESLVETLNYRS